jgi:hypothetical protein
MPTPINISASRGAAILGLSAWKTPVQVWLEIMEAREPGFCTAHNYELPIFEDSPALRWGRTFESAIIELAEKKRSENIEIKIIDREKFYDKNFMTCHIDGRYYCSEVLHEGKTTSDFYFREHFGEPGTDKVPVEYQIQCQHQMLCTGAKKVILSVLVFPRRPEEWEKLNIKPEYDKDKKQYFLMHYYNEGYFYILSPVTWARILFQMGYFHQYHINAHPELQTLMLEKYRVFWENHILTGIPPEPKIYDDIRALVRDPIGTIVTDENIERLMAEYKNIGEEISQSGPLAKRREQIKVSVLDWMRSASVTLDDDSTDKWLLRDNTGRKIVSYGKDKNGRLGFR